jgi:hypothetical protein
MLISKLHGLRSVYVDNFQIGYWLVLLVSLLTLWLSPDCVYLNWKIDTDLWKRMMHGMPIMVAGIILPSTKVR